MGSGIFLFSLKGQGKQLHCRLGLVANSIWYVPKLWRPLLPAEKVDGRSGGGIR